MLTSPTMRVTPLSIPFCVASHGGIVGDTVKKATAANASKVSCRA